MSPKHTLFLSTLAAARAAAASGAFAADPSGSPSRAEVKASVLEARAHGQLRPAGEAAEPFMSAPGGSTLTYRQVRDATLLARAHGELVPAGEGSPVVETPGTQMARADVKEATRQARMHGELIPAGEGIGPVEMRMAARRPEWLAALTRR
jgi:hypothetical protein